MLNSDLASLYDATEPSVGNRTDYDSVLKDNVDNLFDNLFTESSRQDPNAATTVFTVINGWDIDTKNVPEDFHECWGLLITIWIYRVETGLQDKSRIQSLFYDNKCLSRYYNNKVWTEWGDTY